ncbi:MAG: hypothetical protein ACE14L_15945 [Terriglobales bacterium]
MRPDVLALAEQIDQRLAETNEHEPRISPTLSEFLLQMQDANHDLIVVICDAMRAADPSMYSGHIKALLVRMGVLLTVAYQECERIERTVQPRT